VVRPTILRLVSVFQTNTCVDPGKNGRSKRREQMIGGVMLQRIAARSALSEFLHTRRARLSPVQVGLTSGERRRVRGLRRDEVARLAGIGVTWYTWLEQGRDIRVSDALLKSLARALHLDGPETAHLFALAQHSPSPVSAARRSPVILDCMLDGVSWPAYVKTARWDVVAWNRAATILFGDYAAVCREQRNVLWLVFTNPHYREFMVNWEHDARDVMARFRIDFGRAGDDPTFRELVERVAAASPEFRLWWPRHDVADRGANTKTFRHSELGDCGFEVSPLCIEGSPDLRMLVFTPSCPEFRRRLKLMLGAG
jgi:transcriptional regulator with XRE-family HTH domain